MLKLESISFCFRFVFVIATILEVVIFDVLFTLFPHYLKSGSIKYFLCDIAWTIFMWFILMHNSTFSVFCSSIQILYNKYRKFNALLHISFYTKNICNIAFHFLCLSAFNCHVNQLSVHIYFDVLLLLRYFKACSGYFLYFTQRKPLKN